MWEGLSKVFSFQESLLSNFYYFPYEEFNKITAGELVMYEPEDIRGWEEFLEIDEYFEKAQEDIKSLYERNKGSVFFKRQLQIKFEKPYYHWITSNALMRLKNEGHIKTVEIKKKDGTSRTFFIHPSNRYYRRVINRYNKIIDEYSDSDITRSCGHRAEDLFCLALTERGFRFLGKNTREFKGKKWEKTGHDLDFLLERNNNFWGCEVKNSLGYIDKKELMIKLEMCEFFKIRPLFIMRGSPTNYNNEIIKRGGFALIFEAQIYEISQRKLVKKIKEELDLPVDCPKAIPSGIIQRYENWLVKNNL